MPNVTIRDLPDDLHAELMRRATASGRSLQQYLVRELGLLVARPELKDVLQRIETRRGGSVGFATAVEDLAEERGG